MDPVTHLLTGWSLARTGVAGDSRSATVAVMASSVSLDIDAAHLLGGVESYLRHGNSWSHSIAGASAAGAAVGFAFWLWAKRKGQPVSLLRLEIGCVLAACLHLAMDWATPAGVRLLYPFRRKLFALDWMPATDLLLLALFALALFLPWLFDLIQEEIGARKKGPARWGAWLALTCLFLLMGARAWGHADAVAALESYRYESGDPRKIGVFPVAANPFRWHGVADTGRTIEVFDIHLLGGRVEAAGSRFKPAEHPALEAARERESVRVFLSRARFPHAGVARTREGWRVELEDLKCGDEGALCPRLEAVVETDSEFFVTAERLRWGPFGRAAE